MELRLATSYDKNIILQFYKDGSEKLKAEGVDQWQKEKIPNLDNFDDLTKNNELFVLEDKGQVVSTVIIKKYDFDYENNMDGRWISNYPYIAIHRVATGNEYRSNGYGKSILLSCEDYAKRNNIKSLRIDTHRNNKSMQRLIKKLNYTYCGIVYVNGTDERFAFEKILED